METRIVRVVLPVDLIRAIDELIIGGVGGYQSRVEFIEDAARERMVDLTHLDAPELTSSGSSDAVGVTSNHAHLATPDGSHVESSGPVAETPVAYDSFPVLGSSASATINAVDNVSAPIQGGLFGMHNRDYPSLWSLRLLVSMCATNPVPYEDFRRYVIKQAWVHGEHLTALERQTNVKTTALFPTNREKTKSAENGFESFAIGSVVSDSGPGMISTAGPLFQWQAIGLIRTEAGIEIAPTLAGVELVEACRDITVLEPHPVEAALSFIAHLKRFAPDDWRGFMIALETIHGGNADRRHVLSEYSRQFHDWSESQTSTNATGYIARAREWGLIEAKQTKGVYRLTDFGSEQAEAAIGDNS